MAVTARSRVRTVAALALSLTASMAMGLVAVAPAQAVEEPPRPAFYEAPATLPANNGDVIRSEKMTFLLDPLDTSSLVKQSWRIMYKSTNRAGKAIAVTGTVLVPNSPWVGLGTRPVIGYAPGTQGMADRCAPSRVYSELVEYESIGIEPLLARGYAVAVPDYEGLGTAGIHTYMDRVSQGRATLDVVRAAQRLTGTGLSSSSRVGLQGYSQGGGAAASAAELASTYAPELKIKGAVVGAVPADLQKVAENLDGSLFAAFGFFAVRGITASYGLDSALSMFLNEKGVQALQDVEQDCVFNLFDSAFTKSTELTQDGRSLAEIMKEVPFSMLVSDQQIGNIKPSVPVLVTHSRLDDTIPFAVGKAMAKSWCQKGANVRFSSNIVPTHLGGMVPHVAESLPYWEARFAGLPQFGNCWTL
ncbi:lipase [Nocardioides seonyuensis]|uniref:Lipase n=1 Tax=Nocardioides seonyuensis TaxID=2518371 RepID=A0A4P7IG39_9ACTN|nr:lipase family protein [Nocardioides seonyuensis]QBX56226.1 lipase [Nocardioides seonyuensis]